MKNLTHLALAASLSMSAIAVHQSSDVQSSPVDRERFMLELARRDDSIYYSLVVTDDIYPAKAVEGFVRDTQLVDLMQANTDELRAAAVRSLRLTAAWNGRCVALAESPADLAYAAVLTRMESRFDPDSANLYTGALLTRLYDELRADAMQAGATLTHREPWQGGFMEYWVK